MGHLPVLHSHRLASPSSHSRPFCEKPEDCPACTATQDVPYFRLRFIIHFVWTIDKKTSRADDALNEQSVHWIDGVEWGEWEKESYQTNSHITQTSPDSTVTSIVHAAGNTAPTLIVTSRDACVDIEIHVCKVAIKKRPVCLEPRNQRGDLSSAQVLHSVISCCLEGFLPFNPSLLVCFDKICDMRN